MNVLNHQVATLKPFKAMGVDKIFPRELEIGGESVIQGLQVVLKMIIGSKTGPAVRKR